MGIGDWGLGIGDWGLGIGDWPIAKPQSPIPNVNLLCSLIFFIYLFINYKIIKLCKNN